jgi:hypothetical protein
MPAAAAASPPILQAFEAARNFRNGVLIPVITSGAALWVVLEAAYLFRGDWPEWIGSLMCTSPLRILMLKPQRGFVQTHAL